MPRLRKEMKWISPFLADGLFSHIELVSTKVIGRGSVEVAGLVLRSDSGNT